MQYSGQRSGLTQSLIGISPNLKFAAKAYHNLVALIFKI